jgi:DNA invertase Pin-like site-specific DNA recombinase
MPPSEEVGMKRVALYLRVSTDEQTIDNQQLALEDSAGAL